MSQRLSTYESQLVVPTSLSDRPTNYTYWSAVSVYLSDGDSRMILFSRPWIRMSVRCLARRLLYISCMGL